MIMTRAGIGSVARLRSVALFAQASLMNSHRREGRSHS